MRIAALIARVLFFPWFFLRWTWRKKWARDWENVRYCSERCRRAARKNVA